MRIALAGKGGAGKTTISATLARLKARAGAQVVAIDADSNPNLGTALGIDPELLARSGSLPFSLVSRRLGSAALTAPIDEVVRTHGLEGPDGVRVVSMGAPGHADEGCLCSAHVTVSALLSDLGGAPGTVAVVDMEASPEHLSRGTARHADVLLLVTEPYFRSLEAVRRLAELATELPIETVAVVVNKVRSAAESEAVADFCDRHGLTRLGEVPWSDDVTRADQAARPLLDTAPDGAAVAAIAELSTRLQQTVSVR
ncbi:MAG: AAA family ATPase [Pseudonocardiaceae bacterium]|nr:AAA family ATPase [Pseudonocardiaceae bacterium]